MHSAAPAGSARDNGIGFALSLTPAILWGLLPIAIARLEPVMDGVTLTWYRFCFAWVVQTLVLLVTRTGTGLFAHRGRALALVLAVAVGLVTNFAAFASALRYLPASTAQTLSQVQPVLLMVGGAWLFRERLSTLQLGGAAALVVGLVVFVADRLELHGISARDVALGFALVALATVVWPIAALAQKALGATVSSAQTLWYVYLVGAVALAPFATPAQFGAVQGFGTVLFAFCCVNTLLAYGAFGVAVRRWDAARVSAVLAVSPVITDLVEAFVTWRTPGLVLAAGWTARKIVGACVVVIGAMVTALGSSGSAGGRRGRRHGSVRHQASN